MGVDTPEKITAAFERAYNSRDKGMLMALYDPDAVHTFDGNTIAKGHSAISAAFDRGFATPLKLVGQMLSCMVSGDTALLRVQWQSRGPEEKLGKANISCEVLARGSDGLWRYVIDDATGGSRPVTLAKS